MIKLYVAALSLALLAGCGHAEEGDPCQVGQPQCQDESTALFCQDGHYVANRCPGPEGCKGTTVGQQVVVECDIRGTVSGDECIQDYKGLVFCQSATTALVCGGDIWRARTCSSPCVDGQPGIGEVEDPGACD